MSKSDDPVIIESDERGRCTFKVAKKSWVYRVVESKSSPAMIVLEPVGPVHAPVCGTVPYYLTRAESKCDNCSLPIFEVAWGWGFQWRHANGFGICLDNDPFNNVAIPNGDPVTILNSM